MHSPTLLDRRNPLTKRYKDLVSKRKRTDEDEEEIAKVEFFAGLYYSDRMGPYIPARNIEAVIRDGGKAHRQGASVVRGVLVEEAEVPLLYKGPRDIDKLYGDPTFQLYVPVQLGSGSGLMRMRPQFPEWGAEFNLLVQPDQINPDDVRRSLENGGRTCGLLDYRPRNGRFEVVDWEEVEP